MTTVNLPPLFSAQDADGGDPFQIAIAAAVSGCDAGLVVYDLSADTLRAAIVFAPDVPLTQAVAMLPVCGVGFQNALGSIGPPEVAVHLGWEGAIYVNGGACGALRMASADPHEGMADWLVIDLTLSLWPTNDETGLTPDMTALYAEGCAEVNAAELLEAWVRHTLVGINALTESGTKQLHRDWVGLAHGLTGEVTAAGKTGTFIGVDETMGLLLKIAGQTTLIPLTENLTRPT